MKLGLHMEHCCFTHGCKYNDKECPIISGDIKQNYPCENCSPEEAKEVNKYKKGDDSPMEWAQKMPDEELCKYIEDKYKKHSTRLGAAALEASLRLKNYKQKEKTK